MPGLAQIVAFRKSAAAYDERVALQARRAFYARIPSLGAGPVDAAIALGRGGLSVKRSAGGLFGSSDSFHILGSFEAVPVGGGCACVSIDQLPGISPCFYTHAKS